MIKLSTPDIGDEELQEIRKVFDSKYLVSGDKVSKFETLLKEYLNVKHVIAVSSGTAALHLALLALDIGSGDEVIVPDFTFPATANVVENVKADCKFVDISLNTFCIDEERIEEVITEKTKAIIPVQEFGQCCNMNSIMNIAKKYNLKVIEDAACALGSEYNGKKIGTIGEIGCFSLHPRKAITTGEGGIVVTNDDSIAEKIRITLNHGLTYINGKPDFVLPGLNYRMTNIQGAIGIIQMKKLEKINNSRKEQVEIYNKLLKNNDKIKLPIEEPYGKHVWQTYHVLLDESVDRDKVIKRLKENGIECNFGAYSVHSQSYYKNKYNCDQSKYKNSTYAFKYGLALPLHGELKYDDLKYITDTLKEVL
ncbi:DegT/DnrJ/EryC1/StrS family aminotransferase [Clostridium butyricum]|uniref:DegT/DnrJ/EryC1/StrS family aminotransferase n=1 Tax=Clostridium butyricum TaxID=1492 RepID=UPI003D103DB8